MVIFKREFHLTKFSGDRRQPSQPWCCVVPGQGGREKGDSVCQSWIANDQAEQHNEIRTSHYEVGSFRQVQGLSVEVDLHGLHR